MLLDAGHLKPGNKQVSKVSLNFLVDVVKHATIETFR